METADVKNEKMKEETNEKNGRKKKGKKEEKKKKIPVSFCKWDSQSSTSFHSTAVKVTVQRMCGVI